MFSQTVEYALRAIVFLAGKPFESALPQNSEQIATTTKVPHAYLSKVLKQLTEAGLIHSRRGVNGGFVLARDPSELTILEVVNAVDPIQRIKKCPLGLSSHGIRLCPLHMRMDQALASVEHAFAATTLAEILADPNPSVPLCNFPEKPTSKTTRSKK